MKLYIDGLSPDGEVERFDAVRYAAAQWKGKFISAALAFSALVLFFSSRKKKQEKPGIKGVLSDWRATWKQIFKRSSKAHLYTVALIIVVGIVLRALMLNLPIMYDEAFTYTYFASKPIAVILSDYSYPNNHIFHTLLIKLSTSVLGVDLIPLRLPAFIAGVLCMPAVYIFTRAMFNRYIALTALALVAGSGGLIEFSAIARGYSITWLCMLCGLMLARHLLKTNNSLSAVLLGLVCALGMWTIPTMIYSALMIYLSLLLLLVDKYESTLQERLQKLLLSFVAFIALTALFYSPVVIMNSLDQLLYHPTMGENTWDALVKSSQERFTDILYYWSFTSSVAISLSCVVGLVFAGFVSSKFRVLLFSTLLGIVPLVLLQSVIGPPRIWNFAQFIYCIGVAIALFYFMKFVQDKLVSQLSKRGRTIGVSLAVLLLFASFSLKSIPERYYRYTEAPKVARVLSTTMKEGDLLFVDFPWEAPLEFHLLANGTGHSAMFKEATAGDKAFLLLAPGKGQTVASVLDHYNLLPEDLELKNDLMFAGKQTELRTGTLNKTTHVRR